MDRDTPLGACRDATTVIFCLRADSDVDHIVPVIDALAQRKCHRIRAIVYDPIKTFREDYRLQYLHRQYGLSVEHLLQLSGVGLRVRCASACGRWLFLKLTRIQRTLRWNLARSLLRPPLLRLQALLKSMTVEPIVVGALVAQVAQYEKGAVVFDHTNHPLAEAACAMARRQGLVTISLPHSIPHVVSTRPDPAAIAAATENFDWGDLYDAVVMPNAVTAGRFAKDCRDPGILAVVGSPRFSRRWGQTLDAISPPVSWDAPCTRILLILSKQAPHVNWQEVERVSMALSNHPQVSLAIKPHPRTEASGLPRVSSGRNVMIASPELPSSSLIKWADLVVFWGTSVIYDALRLRKPSLHLAYLVHLNFDFEPYIQSWRVDSFQDFQQRLEAFLERGDATYSEPAAQACMAALVEPGGPAVAEHYADLIEKLIDRGVSTGPAAPSRPRQAQPTEGRL